jgi:hypothetical protein
LETKMRYAEEVAAAAPGGVAPLTAVARVRRVICRADARVDIGMSLTLGRACLLRKNSTNVHPGHE